MSSQNHPYVFIPLHQHALLGPQNLGDSYHRRQGQNEMVLRNDWAPIFTCPPEILLQIIQYAIPEPPSLASILRFGAVCRQWRTVAWSSTELWSRICLNFQYSEYQPNSTPEDVYRMRQDLHYTPPSRSDMDVPLMQQWIARAGPTRPLTLQIKCSMFSLQSRFLKCPFTEPSRLLTMFNYIVNRWDRLDLYIPLSWFSYFRGLTFPQLSSVKLRTFEADPRVLRPDIALGDFVIDWATPFLRSVELHGLEVSPCPFPWAQLSHIALYDTRPEGFLEVLPLCKSAVEIKVTILWGAYQRILLNPLARPTQSDLPQLEHLLMFAEDSGFQVNILSGLFAPQVRRITTNLFWDGLGGLPTSIRSFVKRCKLPNLVLGVNLDESKIALKEVEKICAEINRETGVPVVLKGE